MADCGLKDENIYIKLALKSNLLKLRKSERKKKQYTVLLEIHLHKDQYIIHLTTELIFVYL